MGKGGRGDALFLASLVRSVLFACRVCPGGDVPDHPRRSGPTWNRCFRCKGAHVDPIAGYHVLACGICRNGHCDGDVQSRCWSLRCRKHANRPPRVVEPIVDRSLCSRLRLGGPNNVEIWSRQPMKPHIQRCPLFGNLSEVSSPSPHPQPLPTRGRRGAYSVGVGAGGGRQGALSPSLERVGVGGLGHGA